MILSRAPVRLSMGGGGTDLPSYYKEFGGFLLATSINKYVNIVLNKRFEENIRLSYSKTEIVDDISKIEHRIFREALNYTGITRQIELVSVSDVPSNCGLGTSSTFTVALLNALYAYKRNYIGIDKLAEAACHIEIDIFSIAYAALYAARIIRFGADASAIIIKFIIVLRAPKFYSFKTTTIFKTLHRIDAEHSFAKFCM